MINIVVALVVESKPLIEHFALEESSRARGFRVYEGDAARLVVTGVGKQACAAGSAYLGGYANSHPDEAWLNVGIAGHRDLGVGSGVHALRITDVASGRSWYPPQVLAMPGEGKTVLSVDRPQLEYVDDAAYDMEASAFYATAVRFSISELVQCYKVISDNRMAAAGEVNRNRIAGLVAEHVGVIAQIVRDLEALGSRLRENPPKLDDFDRFMERWQFTAPQQHQLRGLLKQWAVRAPDTPLWTEALNRCPSAKSVLGELRDRIDRLRRRIASG